MIVGEIEVRELGIRASNLVTVEGRDSLLRALTENEGPGWLYLAVGQGTSEPGSAQAALDAELYRVPIVGGWLPESGTARLLAFFDPWEGNGQWYEFGIFDEPAKRIVLTTCDGTAGWESDGTLSVSTSYVMQGQASLKTQMGTGGTVAFRTLGMSGSASDWSWTSNDEVMFWYRTSYDVGTLDVRIGNSSVHYYQWNWEPGTVDEWVLFRRTLSSGSVAGTPVLPNLKWLRITHPAAGTVFDEYLDMVALFGTAGNMKARGTISLEKTWNTVLNVYYSIRIT